MSIDANPNPANESAEDRYQECEKHRQALRAIVDAQSKIIYALKAKLDPAQTSIIDAINTLRCEEGSSLTIFCQNPEGCGPDNEAITVSAGWTNWEDRRFTGTTLAECFTKALAAMPDHCKPQTTIAGLKELCAAALLAANPPELEWMTGGAWAEGTKYSIDTRLVVDNEIVFQPIFAGLPIGSPVPTLRQAMRLCEEHAAKQGGGE